MLRHTLVIKKNTLYQWLIWTGTAAVMMLAAGGLALIGMPLLVIAAPVAMGIGLGLGVLALRYPEVMLALLQGGMAIPMAGLVALDITVPEGITLPLVAIASAAGIGLLLFLRPRRLMVFVTPVTFLQVLFAFVVVLGATYSWNQQAWEKAALFILANFIGFGVAAALDSNQRKRLYIVLLLIGLTVAGGILSNFLLSTGGVLARRYEAFGMDVISGARAIGLGMIVLLYAPFPVRYRFIMLFLLGAGLLLAASRGPIAAIVIAVILAPLIIGASTPLGQLSKRTILLIVSGLISLGVVVVIAAIFSSDVTTESWGPFRLIGETNPNDPNISSRFIHWETAFHEFANSPLIGTGTGGYGVSDLWRDKTALNWPHNISLEVIAELGLIGLLVYLSLFTVASIEARVGHTISVRIGDRYQEREILLVFAVLVYAMANAHFSGMFHNNRTIWLALGLIQGLVFSIRQNYRYRTR